MTAGLFIDVVGVTWREAFALDLRQSTAWCRARSLALFAVRRADIEGFARDLEARGRARATVTRRLRTIAPLPARRTPKPPGPSHSTANTSSRPSRTRGRSKRASVARNPASGTLARSGGPRSAAKSPPGPGGNQSATTRAPWARAASISGARSCGEGRVLSATTSRPAGKASPARRICGAADAGHAEMGLGSPRRTQGPAPAGRTSSCPTPANPPASRPPAQPHHRPQRPGPRQLLPLSRSRAAHRAQGANPEQPIAAVNGTGSKQRGICGGPDVPARHPGMPCRSPQPAPGQLQVPTRTSAMVMLSGPPASIAAFHNSSTARPSSCWRSVRSSTSAGTGSVRPSVQMR